MLCVGTVQNHVPWSFSARISWKYSTIPKVSDVKWLANGINLLRNRCATVTHSNFSSEILMRQLAKSSYTPSTWHPCCIKRPGPVHFVPLATSAAPQCEIDSGGKWRLSGTWIGFKSMFEEGYPLFLIIWYVTYYIHVFNGQKPRADSGWRVGSIFCKMHGIGVLSG